MTATEADRSDVCYDPYDFEIDTDPTRSGGDFGRSDRSITTSGTTSTP